MSSSFDPEEVWLRVEWTQTKGPSKNRKHSFTTKNTNDTK
jgi:hypothetical protein